MANIVLAHGIFGIGDLPLGFKSPYFNGIKTLYEKDLHKVLVPSVRPLGPLQVRATQLRDSLRNEAMGWKDLVVIAHSMGGLDIRRVVAQNGDIAARVKVIVTIATPLFGSPVADAVLAPGHALAPAVPSWLRILLESQGGALRDLQTREPPRLQDEDVGHIRYIEVGCSCDEVSASPLFELAQKIGALAGPNDGVVPLKSATHPKRELHEVWPVDHIGAIGWPTDAGAFALLRAAITPPAAHLDRYQRILAEALR